MGYRIMNDDAALAYRTVATPKVHYHVHSSLGSGYLCECDEHYPLSASGRDTALRYERDSWRDYCAEDDGSSDYRITGSVRAGGFFIDDRNSRGWSRTVSSWSCSEPECPALLDGAE